MTEHKNVYAALVAAQQSFGQVKKGSTNPAFKSKYADLADVAAVVIPALNANGVAVLHYIVDCGDDGPQAMRTEFIHANSETRVTCDVRLIVAKNDMQGMKSATTYAKRIGLESLSGIAPEDDDGNAASKSPPKPAEKPVEDVPKHAIDTAKESLMNADTLDRLRDIFTGLPGPVKAHRDVINAKDMRKGELSDAQHDAAVKAEREPDPADQDEIPDFDKGTRT